MRARWPQIWGILGAAWLALGLTAAPAQAPVAPGPTPPAAVVEARINAVLAQMSLERKVAQLIQPDIGSITPADMRRYRFGSILNGGSSGPGGDDKAPAPAWLALADAYWAASTAPQEDGQPVIPALWATDAVHGHNNIIGATLFPHNVGLGAANDPALMRRIGAATAEEIAVTGLDWAFAPTIAVAQDSRWGRTYESYSADPARVARLGPALVEGLQGSAGSAEFLDQHHVLATIKHFFGDGGTAGVDRGDTRGRPAELLRLHAAPYRPAIAAGAQTVMASFSSINGAPMHGNAALLTGLLRDDMHFDGLVVGDWNGHATVPGCSNSDCPRALLAGLDIFMVPDDWRALYETTLREVRDGAIPQARVDEAVRRVLRVKMRYGLFDKPRPSARALAGQWALLGAPAHRALARSAVHQSLVLLKNDGVLPIRASARILVAGRAADSLVRQAGGWSISWQGGGALTNADFPGATSLYAGIAQAAREGGGTATLAPDGKFTRRPDVAVVVFGEEPYAETAGDRPDHALSDSEGLGLLRRFHAAHVRTVAVLLSGRPLWVNRELALADALVAAWLPGSEGAGLADVLLGDARGRVRHDFTGRLPFAWPADCQNLTPPLVALGGGGSYVRAPHLPPLRQDCAAHKPEARSGLVLFDRVPSPGVTAFARLPGVPDAALAGLTGAAAGGGFSATAFDFAAQEDARRLEWRGPGDLVWRLPRVLRAGRGALVLNFALDSSAPASLTLSADCATCHPAADLARALGKGWQQWRVPLHCLGQPRLAALRLRAAGPTVLRLTSARIDPTPAPSRCPAL